MEFHPDSGTLEVEIFDSPQITKEVFLSLVIKIEFQEPMDPDVEDDDYRVNAIIIGIPVPHNDWRRLADSSIEITTISGAGPFEGSIEYYEFWNAIDISRIEFGAFQNGTVITNLTGQLDFTVEGLARFGKPNFDWTLPLRYDQAHLEERHREFHDRI